VLVPAAVAQASFVVYVCGYNLCRVDLPSGASRPITTDGTADMPYRQPKLSRDGTKLAFLHGTPWSYCCQAVDGIYVSDGNASGRVGPFKNQGSDSTPVASQLAMKPDGSRVAYTHDYNRLDSYGFTDTHFDLESFASDGTDQQFIYNNGTYSIGFGPDGYLKNARIDHPYAICLLGPPSAPRAGDAKCTRNVAADPTNDLFDPAVSPDGTKVAASSSPSGSSSSARIEVFDYATGAPLGFITSGPNDGTPAFSPTGDRIAFDRVAGGASDIYVMPAGGSPGSEAKLASGGSQPTWGGGPDTAPSTPGSGTPGSGTPGAGGTGGGGGKKPTGKRCKAKKKAKGKARSAAKKKGHGKKKGCKPKKKKGRGKRR
jgi:hypothetical protein